MAKIEALFERIRKARRLREEASRETATIVDVARSEIFNECRARRYAEKTIGDLIVGKPQYGISTKASEEPIGIPILRMGNIVDGRITFHDLKYVKLPSTEESKYLLNEGDILFNRTNSAELVGKSAVYRNGRKAVFASYLIRIVIDPSKALPDFVATYINSAHGRKFIQGQLTRAIGQVNVNAQKLLMMPLSVPPVNEQRRIVAYLDSVADQVQALKAQQAETEAELRRLEQAILDRAFRGELEGRRAASPLPPHAVPLPFDSPLPVRMDGVLRLSLC